MSTGFKVFIGLCIVVGLILVGVYFFAYWQGIKKSEKVPDQSLIYQIEKLEASKGYVVVRSQKEIKDKYSLFNVDADELLNAVHKKNFNFDEETYYITFLSVKGMLTPIIYPKRLIDQKIKKGESVNIF